MARKCYWISAIPGKDWGNLAKTAGSCPGPFTGGIDPAHIHELVLDALQFSNRSLVGDIAGVQG